MADDDDVLIEEADDNWEPPEGFSEYVEQPAVKIVNELAVDAARARCARIDIACTGAEGQQEARYTVDGTERVSVTPAGVEGQVIRRIKVLCGVDPFPTMGVQRAAYDFLMSGTEVHVDVEFREAEPEEEVTLLLSYSER